jgi:5-methylcytosine-specific restriction endonuclease McrA
LRHEVTQHGKVCEFICTDCGRFFSSQKTLDNHKCPATGGKGGGVNRQQRMFLHGC